MAKVADIAEISNLKTLEDVTRFTAVNFKNVIDVLSGNLTFADNFSAKILTFTFPVAGQSYQIQHNLGHIPVGYLVLKRNSTSIILDGGPPNTAQYINLQASVGGTVTLMIF